MEDTAATNAGSSIDNAIQNRMSEMAEADMRTKVGEVGDRCRGEYGYIDSTLWMIYQQS